MKTVLRLILALLLIAAAGLAGSGCATTETENYSTRPWAQPAGWGHGLPTSINQGR